MRLVRRLAAGIAVGAAAVAATLTAGPPASATAAPVPQVRAAATTWTAAPAGTYAARTAAGVAPYFTDTTVGVKNACTSAALGAQVPGGPVTDPDGLIRVTSASWSVCRMPGEGGAFTYTANGLPWSFDATAYDAATGTTTGTLTGVRIHQAGLCTLDIGGPGGAGSGATLGASFRNGDHTLTVTGGNAVLSGASGLCLGLWNSGDSEAFDAVLTFPGLTITAG